MRLSTGLDPISLVFLEACDCYFIIFDNIFFNLNLDIFAGFAPFKETIPSNIRNISLEIYIYNIYNTF